LNLTQDLKPSTNPRILHWHILIEEFMPELVYIPGNKNVVADALLRLPYKTPKTNTAHFVDECFDLPIEY